MYKRVLPANSRVSHAPRSTIEWTMPMPIASSVFQGSCPIIPGTRNASTNNPRRQPDGGKAMIEVGWAIAAAKCLSQSYRQISPHGRRPSFRDRPQSKKAAAAAFFERRPKP